MQPPHKAAKRLRHKHQAHAQRLSFIPFPFGFSPCLYYKSAFFFPVFLLENITPKTKQRPEEAEKRKR
jgi:hypothetical protein